MTEVFKIGDYFIWAYNYQQAFDLYVKTMTAKKKLLSYGDESQEEIQRMLNEVYGENV